MINTFFRTIMIQKTLVLLSVLFLITACKNDAIKTIGRSIDNVDDIVPLDSIYVKPYDYRNVISLSELSISTKKQKFIDLILPGILITKARHVYTQKKLRALLEKDSTKWSSKQKRFLYDLKKKYKTKDINSLNDKLYTHPNSIVLAQAAVECGWGTSRFFLEANNIFGVWSFNEKDQRIKSKHHRNGKPIYLKKYSSISESIEDYFLTIARGPYKDFRQQRVLHKDAYQLIKYLHNYSERGEDYIKQLKIVIEKNNLIQYDVYEIDNGYLH